MHAPLLKDFVKTRMATVLASVVVISACGKERAVPADTAAAVALVPASPDDWQVTGGEPGNSHYSSLDQLTRANVKQLKVAWTFHTGDSLPPRSEMQATPIVVGGVMYTTTPALKVVALRADSGRALWSFDPFAGRPREAHANRGVVYWSDGASKRILFSAARRLYALDATTGMPIPTFGDSGWVDLGASLGRDLGNAFILATSPGVIYKDLLIQGTRVGEGEGSAPGHVRAYDVRTGKVQWTFHTIPQPSEEGYDTWPVDAWKTVGGANSWAGMSVDAARGLVYVPTGSATPDFYGGNRIGQTLYANTLLALDAATGKRKWHFQTVHHDIWDRDLPAAPNLMTVTHGGVRVDAVAQITKAGFVYLFDRQTGTPLFPIEERKVPASDLNGESAWATQPFPTKPAPFARQSITESDLTTLSSASHSAVLARFRTLRNDGLFTPPSRRGSIVIPGFDGGGEWGGAAIDRDSGVLYVNASDVPWIAAMRDTASLGNATGVPRAGPVVYAAACAGCHKADRKGDGDRVPSLIGIATRRTSEEIRATLERGKGFMPSFAALMEPEKQAIVAYLANKPAPVFTAEDSPHAAELAAPRGKGTQSPYEFVGYERWQAPDGYPAIKPPWGTLSAIDMNTGEYRWRITLGTHPELQAKGVKATGTEQYGGPIVTAGGLVFIAATQDSRIRAFDKSTGALLWEAPLPAAGFATPSTYRVGGKQYVVIACGGGKLGMPSGDSYVAFALP